MKLLLRLFDYVYLSRPILFFPGWATMLAGYYTATSETQQLFHSPVKINPIWWDYPIILCVIAFGCAMGGSFILNQLQDIATDRKNNKLFLVGNGLVSISQGYRESIVLIVLSLLVSIIIGWEILFVNSGFILVTGYIYNFPPFKLKSYPIWGLLANMVMGWFAFVLGWLLLRPFGWFMLYSSLPFLAYNTSLYLLTTLPDMEGDTETAKITFPIKFGFGNTCRLSLLFWIGGLLFSIVLMNQFLIAISLIVAPFYIRFIKNQTTLTASQTLKMGIFFFSLGVCFKFPLFLGLILIAFFVTRLYYLKRFGIKYPTFGDA